MKVTVINHYAGNKGDRAVLYFLVRELKRFGCADITVSAHDRAFWTSAQDSIVDGVKLVPWGWSVEGGMGGTRVSRRVKWEKRRFYRKIALPLLCRRIGSGGHLGVFRAFVNREYLKAISSSDLVISTGGHHITTRFLQNFVSPLMFDLLVARMVASRLLLWSQTIGPLEFTDDRAQLACQQLLRNADQIYARDDSSRATLDEWGVQPERISETFESVIGLSDEITEYTVPSSREPVVGITIYNAEPRSHEEHREYIAAIASTADYLVEKGLKIRFFPHEVIGAAVDDRVCITEIIHQMKQCSEAEMVDEDLDTLTHLTELSKCRLFIAHKTHSVVFALTVGTPVIALSYHSKTEDFMSQYGLSEHCVCDSGLTVARLTDAVDRVLRGLDETGRRQFDISRKIGARVREDLSRALNNYIG